MFGVNSKILSVFKMKQKITNKDLKTMSTEELMNKINGCAIDVHFYDGRVNQLCVNDLRCFNRESFIFSTRTGIEITIHEVDYIEVISID